MKKRGFLQVISYIIVLILVPIIFDLIIFGNNIPSNLDNNTWAGFLGGYLGGVITLIGVFITIKDNNKKIEEHRKEELQKETIQRKLNIRPYLETGLLFFGSEAVFGSNDRVFEIEGEEVKQVKYDFSQEDKHHISYCQRGESQDTFIKYYIRNIGAGSAVDMNVKINGFNEEIAIAKDEKVNMYMMINMKNIEQIHISVELDYWDIEKRGHYLKKDSFIIYDYEDKISFKLKHEITREITENI